MYGDLLCIYLIVKELILVFENGDWNVCIFVYSYKLVINIYCVVGFLVFVWLYRCDF